MQGVELRVDQWWINSGAARQRRRRRGACRAGTVWRRGACETSMGRLLGWQDMPSHLQFNPYIHTGYRPVLSLWGSVRSLFYLHNETINIITHGQSATVLLSIDLCRTLALA